jgi:hypothetical protein
MGFEVGIVFVACGSSGGPAHVEISGQTPTTQAEADALARESEAGNSPPPEEIPAECALLAEPPPGC